MDTSKVEYLGPPPKINTGVKLTKQIMRKALDSTYGDIYDLEAKTQNTLTGSEDNIEGVTAFMEKRQPNFK